jgi:hypothetical protein
MADELARGFQAEFERKADRRLPESPQTASSAYGWTARDIAQRFDVSERTARRWRQQDRIPERRRAEWRRQVSGASRDRARQRIERRGLSGMKVQGRYRVSRSRYETHPDAPVRIMGGSRIPGAAMREFFSAMDEGDVSRADELLGGALAEAYGMGQPMDWERVDEIDYRV